MEDLNNLLKEYKHISARREQILFLVKKRLTVHYKEHVYSPKFYQHKEKEDLVQFANDYLESGKYEVFYDKHSIGGELKEWFFSDTLLTKDNIEKVLNTHTKKSVLGIPSYEKDVKWNSQSQIK